MYEVIIEKENGLYTRINAENDSEIKRFENLGFNIVKYNLTIHEVISFCEEHNKPILDKKIIKE